MLINKRALLGVDSKSKLFMINYRLINYRGYSH